MQFYLTSAVAEKGIGEDELGLEQADAIGGSVWTNVIAIFIVVATATTIGVAGGPITSASDAARGARAGRRAAGRGALRGRAVRGERAGRDDHADLDGVRDLRGVRLGIGRRQALRATPGRSSRSTRSCWSPARWSCCCPGLDLLPLIVGVAEPAGPAAADRAGVHGRAGQRQAADGRPSQRAGRPTCWPGRRDRPGRRARRGPARGRAPGCWGSRSPRRCRAVGAWRRGVVPGPGRLPCVTGNARSSGPRATRRLVRVATSCAGAARPVGHRQHETCRSVAGSAQSGRPDSLAALPVAAGRRQAGKPAPTHDAAEARRPEQRRGRRSSDSRWRRSSRSARSRGSAVEAVGQLAAPMWTDARDVAGLELGRLADVDDERRLGGARREPAPRPARRRRTAARPRPGGRTGARPRTRPRCSRRIAS